MQQRTARAALTVGLLVGTAVAGVAGAAPAFAAGPWKLSAAYSTLADCEEGRYTMSLRRGVQVSATCGNYSDQGGQAYRYWSRSA